MIQIRLMQEGKLIKKISSRVSESIVLQQLDNFEGEYDEIHYYGNLSEDFKDTMKKVGKKIVPAAMASGIAMGAADHAGAQTIDLDQNIGSLIGQVFSPNYQQLKRERDANKRVERRAWEAKRRELDRARVAAAREAGKREAERLYGKSSSSNKKKAIIYDQARLSKSGRTMYLYRPDGQVLAIKTKDLEWVEGDARRMGHYLNPRGKVYYVKNGIPLPEGRGRATHKKIRDLAK